MFSLRRDYFKTFKIDTEKARDVNQYISNVFLQFCYSVMLFRRRKIF